MPKTMQQCKPTSLWIQAKPKGIRQIQQVHYITSTEARSIIIKKICLTFVDEQLVQRFSPLHRLFRSGPANKGSAVLQQTHLCQVSHCMTHSKLCPTALLSLECVYVCVCVSLSVCLSESLLDGLFYVPL